MSSEMSRVSSTIEIENQPVAKASPQIPVEVYEHIIDWIVILTNTDSAKEWREMVERLSTCSLICRAWRIRAQVHLFKRISLTYKGLPSLDRVLGNNRAVCPLITEMFVMGSSKTNSISFFAIRHQLSNLTHLSLDQLDLTREHQWLRRAPLFRSVERLKLQRLQNCQLSQLVLFINSFPSLARLDIDFDFNKLQYKDQVLPKPSRINTRSLRWLDLQVIPGVSRFIDWLHKAVTILSQLKILILFVRDVGDESNLRTRFEEIGGLLYYCCNSIEDLRLHLGRVPIVDSLSDTIRLQWFQNLRYLTYGSPYKDSVLPYAARQLGAITSARHKLVQVTFEVGMSNPLGQLDASLCGSIDDLLSGDKFPCLEDVFLHKAVAVILFPKLSKAGRLKTLACSDSAWTRGERLPNHLCERIIDWVYYASADSGWKSDWEMRRTLIACSLVCRNWRTITETYLSKPNEVSYEEMTSFSDYLLKDQRVSSGIRRLAIVKKSETTPIYLFATQHRLLRLDYLNIHNLDLTREHVQLYRAPLFLSVRELILHRIQSCQLSQLVRFINAFPSLSRLELNFDFNKLARGHQILPRSCQIDTRSLTRLQLHLTPGISRLIDWLLDAKPLLARLRTLILCAFQIEDEHDLRCSFEGVERLLNFCCGSVEDLRLQLKSVPMVENISDIGAWIFLEYELCSYSPILLVKLASFPKLKYLEYGCLKRDSVLPYAARQLKAIPSVCRIIEVYFDIELDGHHLDQDICRTLDSLLTGDRFPSLQSVGLNKTIAPELFPVLNETSRLFVLSSSFWMDGPIRKQTSVAKNNNENTIKAEKSAERITEIIEDDTLEGPTANDASNSLTNHD